MRTTATVFAALMSAVLWFNKPEDETPPAPANVAACCADDCDCCDCDIDAVIERVANVEATLQQHAKEIAEIEKCHADDLAELKAMVAAAPEPLPPPVPLKVVPQPAKPAPVKAAPVVVKPAPVVSSYTPRWQNYDGKDRLTHAAQDHGIDVSRYTPDQVLRMMDADHDRYGAGHSAIKASRNVVTYSQPQRVYQPVQRVMSNCPGGVCPTQPRQGLFRRWAR